MNVLLIAHKNPYPPNDGGSMGIYTMIEGLLLNKISLDVLMMNPSKIFKPFDQKNAPTQLNDIRVVTIDTRIKPIKALMNLIFSKQSYFVSRFYDKKFEQTLIHLLKNNRYEIIQLESIFSAVYIPVIKKYSSAKIVLSAHNIEHQIWQRLIQHEKNILKKYYLQIQIQRLKSFEEKIVQISDGITAVTENNKKYISSLTPDKPIVVTPNGMDIKKFDRVSFEKQKTDTIFFLGSLDWIPNQQGIIWFLENVWDKILQKKPDLKLIVAGKKIPDWLKNRKEKNTTFYSDVPDTKELYHQYAIMIVPLLAGSGIRVRIIEGMAFGKCIVSTSIGAEAVPYTHQKNIWISDTPNNFADAIVYLINHPEVIKQIQQEARTLAEQYYDIEKVYLPLVQMYHTLTSIH